MRTQLSNERLVVRRREYCCEDDGYGCDDFAEHFGCTLTYTVCQDVELRFNYSDVNGQWLQSNISHILGTLQEVAAYVAEQRFTIGGSLDCWYSESDPYLVRLDTVGFNAAAWFFCWLLGLLILITMTVSCCGALEERWPLWSAQHLLALQLLFWVGLIMPLAILLPFYLSVRFDHTANQQALLIGLLHLVVIGGGAPLLYLLTVRNDGTHRLPHPSERRAQLVWLWYALACYPSYCWLLPLSRDFLAADDSTAHMRFVACLLVLVSAVLLVLLLCPWPAHRCRWCCYRGVEEQGTISPRQQIMMAEASTPRAPPLVPPRPAHMRYSAAMLAGRPPMYNPAAFAHEPSLTMVQGSAGVNEL